MKHYKSIGKVCESSPFRLVFAVAMASLVAGIAGCDSTPRLPTSSNNPDTTGQGGNTGGINDAGTIYFRSTTTTPWLTDLPAFVSDGVLLAENESTDTLIGTITYNGRIGFADNKNLSFFWKGGATGNTLIYFYISSDGTHWQNTPYYPSSDWQRAPYTRFIADGIPLTFKFVFKLPPGGRARITEVRAYGK